MEKADNSSIPMDSLALPFHEPFQGPRGFRLLSISEKSSQLSCTLNTFTIGADDCPQFKALSYTWGSPIYGREEFFASTRTIVCNGQPFAVGLNLWDALEQLRTSGYEGYIWIDAICINQQNKGERNAQVLLMGDIYASALEVIIWLGKDTAFLSDVEWLHNQTSLQAEAWDLLKQSRIYEAQTLLFPTRRTDETSRELLARLQGYWRFFEFRTWFTRAWTVQEFTLARNIVIWCGRSKLCWSDTFNFLTLLDRSGTLGYINQFKDIARGEGSPTRLDRLGICRETCQRGLNGEIDFIEAYWDGRQRSEDELEALYFHNFAYATLKMVRALRSSDDKDKIFSIIGITERLCPRGITPIIQPDYQLSTEQIYKSCAFALIQRLPSLILLSSVEDREFRRLSKLPSWTPDYTFRAVTLSELAIVTGCCKYKPTGHLEHYHQPRLIDSTLTLHGYPIGVVTATSLAGCIDMIEWQNPTWLEYLCSILTLADPAGLSTHYNSSAPNILGRTLIANAVEGKLAPDSIDSSFYSWFVCRLTNPASFDRVNGGPGSPQWTIISAAVSEAIHHLISGSVSSLWAGLPTELRLLRTYSGDSDWIDSAARKASLRHIEHEAAFNLEFSATTPGRKLFRTSKGLLGLGAKSMREGDVVWAMENAQMTMILRPNQPGAIDGLMELMGDAYLHGCMNGEMFEASGVDRVIREVNIV
jgi:Heterokaryon incompatibility protein (HET)